MPQPVKKLSPTGKIRGVLPPEGGKIRSKLVIFGDICLENDTSWLASVPKGRTRQAVSLLSKKAFGLFRQFEEEAA